MFIFKSRSSSCHSYSDALKIFTQFPNLKLSVYLEKSNFPPSLPPIPSDSFLLGLLPRVASYCSPDSALRPASWPFSGDCAPSYFFHAMCPVFGAVTQGGSCSNFLQCQPLRLGIAHMLLDTGETLVPMTLLKESGRLFRGSHTNLMTQVQSLEAMWKCLIQWSASVIPSFLLVIGAETGELPIN